MKTNPNDAAFPKLPTSQSPSQLGVTKRELFAAMAMQGILANPDADFVNYSKAQCQYAVEHADALIEALNK